MTKEDDLSEDHLKWLVKSRSENQRISLALFSALKAHPKKVREDYDLSSLARGLIATSFSLWRAVFLSDKVGGPSESFDDAEIFLGKLILDNAVAYPQDRNAREW